MVGEGDLVPQTFSKALKSLGIVPRVEMRIASPGGDCFVGSALFDIATNSGIKFDVRVDGIAASMGSYLAMIGERITMGASAQMMLHDPAANGSGGVDALERTAKLLSAIRDRMARIYAARSGQPEDAVRRMMEAETWMDAAAAVRAGFADAIGEDLRLAAAASKFDLSGYRNPPAPTTPKTMGELSEQFWAGKGKSPAPLAVGDEDVSDLIPAPKSHAEVWANFNRQGRGRMGGVK